MTSVTNVLDLSPKKVSGFSGITSHSRPSLPSFSSTLSLFSSKATLLFYVFKVCYVLNILFVCTYNKMF